jgi:hypothetical protein
MSPGDGDRARSGPVWREWSASQRLSGRRYRGATLRGCP